MAHFQNTTFLVSAAQLSQLPPAQAEVAFVGRSNAGKSTALNTLVNRRRLAFVSKTPGRTQLINYFQVEEGHCLVDLPGYGFAQTPERIRSGWDQLLGGYLSTREPLRGLVLIMDARHPLRDKDWQLLNWVAPRGLPIHILLSKADKLTRREQAETLRQVQAALQDYPTVSVQLFSGLKKTGTEVLSAVVLAWLGLAAPAAKAVEQA